MNALISIAGNVKSASELGVVSAKIIKRCSGIDELKMDLQSPESAKAFAIGKDIEIFVNGVRKFCGNIAKTPISLAGKSQKASIVAYNAWKDLDDIVYQQEWMRMRGDNIENCYRSKIVLGQNKLGNKINVAEQLFDIGEYAIKCGANFRIGKIDINAPMLLDETQDLSCAQAILRVLKWAPNSAVFFDYSQDGLPILNIQKRTSLEKTSIDTTIADVLKISITPRPDLSLEGVSIKYEQENIENSNSTLIVSEENYPPEISSNSKKVLVMSVELDGKKASCDTYKIVCQTIDIHSVRWWCDHIPSLSEANTQIIEASISDDTYPRELIEGNIISKMNFHKQSAIAKAKIRYLKADGTICTKAVATRVLTTDAQTGTYSIWHTTQYAEPKPNGLAQAIYEASSTLEHEGTIVISDALEREFIGKLISINSPEHTEWASINSTAVFVEENIGKQQTLIKFGPPKHLYPDQLVELFRISRNRKITEASWLRSTANNNASAKDMTTQAPLDNGGEGDTNYERFLVAHTTDTSAKTIDINANDIGANETAQMRKIYLCHNGYLATAKVLMTAPSIVETT